MQNRMQIRPGRTPTRQVCNSSARVPPNNGTTKTTYIILLRLVLVGAHHLPHRCARPARVAPLWPRGWRTGKGCLARRDVRVVSRIGYRSRFRFSTRERRAAAPLWGNRHMIIEPGFEVIAGAALQGCAVIPRAMGVGTGVLHVYLGNNFATMGRSLVVITAHSPWYLTLFVFV